MRYQFIEKDQRGDDEGYTCNFVQTVNKFGWNFIPEFIGIKRFCGVEAKLNN